MENNKNEKTILDYGDDNLEYVKLWANTYFPDLPPIELNIPEGHDISEYLGESLLIDTFIDRYNDKRSKANFSFSKYMANKELDLLLSQLNLDKTKLWYLLLFMYDFSWGQCKEELNWSYVNNQIMKFIQKIEEYFPEGDDTIVDKKINVVLREDKKVICRIDDIKAIHQMAKFCGEGIDSIKYTSSYMVLSKQTSSNGKMAYFFARQMVNFFSIPTLKIKRRKGASVSDIEKEVIMEILKFTQLVSFEKSLTKEYFNALMSKFKNEPITGLNNYYLC